MNKFSIDAYYEIAGQDSSIDVEDLFILIGQLQDTFGCVPKAAVQDLSARSGVPEARIWGALSAYPDFKVT